MTNNLEIIALVEERSEIAELKTEHGLSFLLKVGGEQWLFDTGQTGIVVENARKLGVTLSDIEGIILSHGHYDHSGGLRAVLGESGAKKIYAHPGIFRRRYNLKKERKFRSIGFPDRKAVIEKKGGEFDFSRDRRQISFRICLSGEIPHQTDFEKGEPDLVIREKMKYMPDPFIDEQYLVVESDDGLIMINGCCHSGLINSLRHLRLYRPQEKIRAIIGGLHLRSADSATLDKVMDALKEFEPESVIAGHCTGEAAETRLAREFGSRFKRLKAGVKYEE